MIYTVYSWSRKPPGQAKWPVSWRFWLRRLTWYRLYTVGSRKLPGQAKWPVSWRFWLRRLTWYILYTVGQGSHLVRLSDQSPGDYCKTNIYYSCYLIFMCSPPWIYWWDFIFAICHILIHYAYIRISFVKTLFSHLYALSDFVENKVLINKKCFAVLSVHPLWFTVGQGSYLVRPSDQSPGDYSLYVLCDKTVQRFRIEKEGKQLYLMGGRYFDRYVESQL